MPDGLIGQNNQAATVYRGAEEYAGRSDRPVLLGFANDAETETALRDGLAEALQFVPQIRRANISQAIAALQRGSAPVTLVVDVSGEAQPLAALEDLSQVVPPDVNVLVVGDRQDMDFYRRLTRGLGVREYLFKPLTVEMVARNFGPAVGRRSAAVNLVRGGRVVTVMGARPGVGASTIATNFAWYLGNQANRNTVLIDPDLQTGTAALMLGVRPTSALRDGLENPTRMDDLYVERAVESAGPRLDVLASEIALDETALFVPGAAGQLLDTLQRRYNFIVIDLPIGIGPLFQELHARAHQSVIVFDPSLPAIRDTLRLLSLAPGPHQVRSPMLVLNRANLPGGVPLAQVNESLQSNPDVVIPDIGRKAREAELSGKPAVTAQGPMRDAIAAIAQGAAGVNPAAVKRSFFARLLK